MRSERGMSLVELLATVAILGIALGMAALYLRPMGTPLGNGVSLTESFLREARSSALATTSAFRVRPEGPLELAGQIQPFVSILIFVDIEMGADKIMHLFAQVTGRDINANCNSGCDDQQPKYGKMKL